MGYVYPTWYDTMVFHFIYNLLLLLFGAVQFGAFHPSDDQVQERWIFQEYWPYKLWGEKQTTLEVEHVGVTKRCLTSL